MDSIVNCFRSYEFESHMKIVIDDHGGLFNFFNIFTNLRGRTKNFGKESLMRKDKRRIEAKTF